ncbi:MAG: MarR family transcriptional regulator [Pseudomonadota bacterium]
MALSKQDWMLTWASLVHASTRLQAGLERELREALGFGLSEQDLIKQLNANGGRLTLTELSERIFLSKAGLTRMLDRLQDAGLVVRAPVDGDRRSMSAALTAAGETAFARSRTILEAYVRKEVRDRLAENELLALKTGLEALLRGHGVWEGQMEHLKGGPAHRKKPA